MRKFVPSLLLIGLIAINNPGLAQQDARTAEIMDYRQLWEMLHQYAMSVETANIETIKPLFHERAMTYGTLMGEQVIDTPDLYFQFLQARPKPQDVGENLIATITYVHIEGDIASAEVQYANHFCAAGTNHLGLIRDSGNWKIASMMFWVRPAPGEIDHSGYPEGYCHLPSPIPEVK